MDEREFSDKFDFLEKLSADEKKYFLDSAACRDIEAGTLVIGENSACDGVTFVLSGELKVFKVSENGREIALYNVSPGGVCVLTVACFVGVGKSVSPVSVVALQKSRIVVLPCHMFRYIFSISPAIQQYFLKNTLESFYDMISLVERLTFKSVNERLWDHLLKETESGKKPLYTTHAQLAARLGTSREVVTRRLRGFESAGVIAAKRGKITVVKPDALIGMHQDLSRNHEN